MKEPIFVTIDNKQIAVEGERNLLELVRKAKIDLPTFCYHSELSVYGACRLCMVEVRGVPRLLPACATSIVEGMDVTVDSPKVGKYRKMILELLLAERNHICAACVSNGHCELQALAQRLGVHHTRYPYRYPRLKVDASHARFNYDPNRCVLCTRCMRACEEVEGARTWNVMGRGIHSVMVTDLHQPWGESPSCTSCSKCVHVCPTGALSEKGCVVGEMVPRANVFTYLKSMRYSGR